MTPAHLASFIGLALAGAGCVLPMEPAFSDPFPNHPPYIVSANPAQSSVLHLASAANSLPQIIVQIGDQNVENDLYVRWVVDYPGTAGGPEAKIALEAILPPSGHAERPPIRFTPSCLDDQLFNQSAHRISLIIADRAFETDEALPQDKKWSTTQSPGFVLQSSWFLTTECKNQQQRTP